MKAMQISEDIMPIGEFKVHAAQVFRKLNDTNRPVVVTQNGRPTAVVISPIEFDRMKEQIQFMRAINKGIAESNAGNVVADEEVWRFVDEEFGVET